MNLQETAGGTLESEHNAEIIVWFYEICFELHIAKIWIIILINK
jgi:hypothetical protein